MILNIFIGLILAICAILFAFTRWEVAKIEAQFPPSGRFVDVPDGRIHYVIQEPDIAGPVKVAKLPVLLLHGASGNSADMMTALAVPLTAAGFKVIAVDRPGQGWSARFGGQADASPARQAMIIRSAMEAIGIHEAIVLGHSLAGAIAVNFALDQKDFTKGLILVSPVTHPWPGGIAWHYHAAANPIIGPVFSNILTMPVGLLSLDSAISHVFEPNGVPSGYRKNTKVDLVLRPAAFVANAQDVAVLEDFVTAQSKRLGEIDVPTAIVTGDKDNVVLMNIHSRGSARDIPGASLTILDNTGHAPHHSHPEAIVAGVAEVESRLGVEMAH